MELNKIFDVLQMMSSVKVEPESGEWNLTEDELNDTSLFIPQIAKEFKKFTDVKIVTSKESFFTCTFDGKIIDVNTQMEYLKSKDSIPCRGCYRANLQSLRSYTKNKEINCVGVLLRRLNNR